jgi:hypothetical protein
MLAADLRQDLRVKDRAERRAQRVGEIGMPVAPDVLAHRRFSVNGNRREHEEFGVIRMPERLQRLVQVELAETPAVSDELLRRDVLPAHEHDPVLVPERTDLGNGRVGQRLPQIDVQDLDPERIGKLTGTKRAHRVASHRAPPIRLSLRSP